MDWLLPVTGQVLPSYSRILHLILDKGFRSLPLGLLQPVGAVGLLAARLDPGHFRFLATLTSVGPPTW